MKINMIVIDKPNIPLVIEWMSVYEKRIIHYCKFELTTIHVPKNVRYKSIDEQKKEEEALILKQLKPSDSVILLDEKGKEYTSVEFSRWLEKQSELSKRMVFIIGGPYGFSEYLKQQFPLHLSLSKMTLSHEMIRVLFLEQLYRAFSIIHGQKYHH